MKNQNIYKDKKFRSNQNKGARNNGKSRSYEENRRSDTNHGRYDAIVTDTKRAYDSVTGAENDANWYKDSAGIVESAARISTKLVEGFPYVPLTGTGASVGDNTADPGVMVMDWIPCPGTSDNINSPLSISAQVLYQQIRKTLNKTLTGYQFADPLIAYICFLSMAAYAREIARDFKIMNTYSTLNMNFPRLLMRACGYSDAAITDFRSNYADYLDRYRMLMYDMSSIFMPIETNIMEKYKWLTDTVFVDHESTKGQIYMYRMSGVYQFDETTSDQGSMAKCIDVLKDDNANRSRKMLNKLNTLRDCIDKLRNSDSYNYMMSDMQKAFPDATTYSFQIPSREDILKPVYNEMMLEQFHNIETLPYGCDIGRSTGHLAQFDYTQDVAQNTLLCTPRIPLKKDVEHLDTDQVVSSMRYHLQPFFDTYGHEVDFSTLDPDVDTVIDNLHGVLNYEFKPKIADQDDPLILLSTPDSDSFSCVVYEKMVMFNNVSEVQGGVTKIEISPTELHTVQPVHVSDLITKMWKLSTFDWHPGIYFITISDHGDVEPMTCTRKFWESNNWTLVPKRTLSKLFSGEKFGLWKVPENVIVGKI